MSHFLYLHKVQFDFVKLISGDVANLAGNYQLRFHFGSRTERHK